MEKVDSETHELCIDKVVYRGKGLSRVEGMVCFVPGVLPGETVRAVIAKRHRNYMVARLREVVTPSPARISPGCPLAFAPAVSLPCPGCAYQHVDYSEEVRLKQAQLGDMLEHHARVPSSCFVDPVPSPSVAFYRNKIVLHENYRAGRHAIGYFGEDNSLIVDVPSCPLAVTDINALVKSTRDRICGSLNTGRGRVEHTFRYTAHDGAIHYREPPGRSAPWLTEKTVLGEIKVPRGSFFQVNSALTGDLAKAVMQHIESYPSGRVIDLYCGAGLFSLGAARAGAIEVLGIDADRAAVQAADYNARQLGMEDKVHFLAAAAETGLRRAMDGVAAEELTVILDPPRSGLNRSVIDAILESAPRRLIYVSCAADTLARDLHKLVESGYRVGQVQLLDMFPRTAVFETVVALGRSDACNCEVVAHEPDGRSCCSEQRR